MADQNVALSGKVLGGCLAALAAMSFAFALVFSISGAWADGDDEAAFADVSDVSESAAPAAQADGEDASAVEANADASGASAEQADENAPDASAQDSDTYDAEATEAEGQVDGARTESFAKSELTVKQGEYYLVGFAPKASDAKGEDGETDDELAAWYKDWKSFTEANDVETGSKGGWLNVKDAQGEAIDYNQIVGIVTEDAEVFELFGEYPEYKIDDQGVEYRWWYGLLGKAAKAGDTKLKIIYGIEDGEGLVADECIVHVVAPESNTSVATVSTQEEGSEASSGEQAGVSTMAQAESNADDAQSQNGSTGTDSSGSGAADANQSATGSSNLSSRSAANGGTGLSTQSEGSENSTASSTADASSANRAVATGYPKQVATTGQGSSVVATLLVNDAAAEEAFLKLANNSQVSLTVEPQTAFASAAETSLSSIARTAGLDVAERLAIKAVNAENVELDISNMNVTVKMALDDALKAIDATSVQVWYVNDDGSNEKKDAKIDSGFMTFTTNHLSNYAVLGKKSTSAGATSGNAASNSSASATTSSGGKTGLPQTGDTMGYLAIALAFVAGFSAASALNARRRMQEKPFNFNK